jgi:hypothetical protein
MEIGARLIIFVTSVAALLCLSTYSLAGIPAILSDKDDVKDIIQTFRGEMSALIAQAGGETRITMIRAFQLAQASIDALAATYDSSVKKTFGQLDEQQRKLFEDTRRILSDTEKNVNGTLSQAIQVGKDFNTILNAIANFSGKPIVTGYGTGYVPPTGTQTEFPVTITGFKLHMGGDNRPPSLRVNGKEVRGGGTDNAVYFVLQRSFFPENEKRTTFARAELTLYEDQSHWYLPWHWIWPDIRQTRYDLLFTVLPRDLGTFTVHSRIQGQVEETKQYSSRILVADHTHTPEHDCFVPERGWRFDIATLVPKVDKKLGWYKGEPDNRYNHGGVSWWEGMTSEKEICLRVDANVGAKEDSAHTEGHFEVKMFRSVDTQTDSDLPERKLDWSSDESVPLIDAAITQEISVKLFDEVRYIQSATESKSLPFLTIDPNTRNKAVYLRPSRDWTVR